VRLVVPGPRHWTAAVTRPRRADAVCLLILVACCLLLRIPALDVVVLNPDESQYAATASYLAEEGISAFALPHIGGAGVFVYRLAAEAFGPYAVLPVRVLVMLICLVVSVLLYCVVRAVAGPWGGLASGLVFVHYNLAFEGLSANREWFVLLFLMSGALLYALSLGREGRRATWLSFGAGLANGVALAFKLQALYISGAILVLLAWRMLVDRRLRPTGQLFLAHAAGLGLGVSLYLTAFLLAGSLDEYLPLLLAGWRDYVRVEDGAFPLNALRRLDEVWFSFYERLPHRLLTLPGYALGLLAAAAMVLPFLGGRRRIPPPLVHPTVLLFTLYLGGAMLSVQMGRRYFEHYYLFLLLPLAALVGHAVGLLMRPRVVAAAGLGIVIVGWLLIELGLAVAGPRATALSAAGIVAHVVFYLALAVMVTIFAVIRPFPTAPRVLGGLVWLQIAVIVVLAQASQPPPNMPYRSQGFARLVQRIDDLSRPEDRLFVCGWAPEVYALTRRVPATQFAITEYVVGDFQAHPIPPRIDPHYADLLMGDLERNRPALIADCAERSLTMARGGDPSRYRLSNYPDFAFVELLERDYKRVDRLDGCDLYVRQP